MKKINFILILVLTLLLVPVNTITAISDTNLNINIDNSNPDKVVVTIPDDNTYEVLQPEISVNTPFSKVNVQKDGEAVEFTIANGVVTFTIDDYDCDYVISKVSSDNNSKKPKSYNAPKTGIN